MHIQTINCTFRKFTNSFDKIYLVLCANFIIFRIFSGQIYSALQPAMLFFRCKAFYEQIVCIFLKQPHLICYQIFVFFSYWKNNISVLNMLRIKSGTAPFCAESHRASLLRKSTVSPVFIFNPICGSVFFHPFIFSKHIRFFFIRHQIHIIFCPTDHCLIWCLKYCSTLKIRIVLCGCHQYLGRFLLSFLCFENHRLLKNAFNFKDLITAFEQMYMFQGHFFKKVCSKFFRSTLLTSMSGELYRPFLHFLSN